MYLHLGQSVVVPYRDVVGIFDLDNTSSSHLTRAFLERAEKEGRVVNVSDDLPRSFVLCTQGGETAPFICLSSRRPLCCGGRRATVSNKFRGRAAGGGSCKSCRIGPWLPEGSQWRFSNV